MGLYFNISTCLLALMMIVYNFRFNKSAVYLGISLLTLNLNAFFVHVGFGYHSVFWTAIFFANFIPFSFLVGPFLYFFVRGTLTGKDSISLRDTWLFIPSVISAAATFPYWMSPFSYKLKTALFISQNPLEASSVLPDIWISQISFVLFSRSVLFLTCYSLIFYTIWKYSPSHKTSQRIGQREFIKIFRWLLFFTLLFSILAIFHYIGLSYFLQARTPAETLNKISSVWLIRDIGFLLISVCLLIFPTLLYGRTANFSRKGVKFSFANIEKFHQVFYEQHFFLNPAANLEGLANTLNIDKEDIVSFVQHQEGVGFADFLQKSRIDYLAELLKVKANQAFTIDAMSEMAGFGSRQAMYLAFKKFKNCSPTEFIYSINN